MKDTQAVLRLVNQMQDDGVIGKYAIGGAIAAAFYIEPSATYDIDIFIPFDQASGSSIASLSHIYNYLLPRGCKAEGAHIIIEGWQVQFLPAGDPLYLEALGQAIETSIGEVKTWVMTAEHLMAIALQTGRGKDFIRIEQFVRYDDYDDGKLIAILNRHGLMEKWAAFNEKYVTGQK